MLGTWKTWIRQNLLLLGLGLAPLAFMLGPISLAQAFHDETPTLSPIESGPSTFEAHAGDVISIRAQSSGGNTTCTPSVTYTEGIYWWGVVRRTPFDRTQVLQIEQDGVYEYVMPTPLDEVGGCSLTIGPANRYEQLIVEAQELPLYGESETEQLALYEQAIELEPAYPEAYKHYIVLLLESQATEADWIENDVDKLGAMFLSWPETTRSALVSAFEELAQIYEASPEWQQDERSNPLLLRNFAEFIQTGKASDRLREVLSESATEEF